MDSRAGKDYAGTCRLVLEELEKTLAEVEPAAVSALVDEMLSARTVFVVGVGRVMLCMQAFAKRLNHIGLKASCVGDTNEPPAGPGDLLVAASGSGESVVPVAIARTARRLGARVAHIGTDPRSSLAQAAHRFVRLPAPTKLARPGEPPSRQPMTNRFDQSLYLFCDVVAMIIMDRRGVEPAALWTRHANLE